LCSTNIELTSAYVEVCSSWRELPTIGSANKLGSDLVQIIMHAGEIVIIAPCSLCEELGCK
jgi:hypothetical protein